MSKSIFTDVSSKEPRSHLTLGKCGEDAAAMLLERERFIILDRNWRCEYGELDIVAVKNKVLAIIEVKTRRSSSAENFSPFAAVDSRKSAKIKKITDRYLYLERTKLRRYRINKIRFDVIGSFYSEDPETNRLHIKVKYLEDAFNY